MSRLVTAAFIVAGLINLYPVIGVLGVATLQSLYGQAFAGDELLLLLRHRAVLFGLLGGLLILAAFKPRLRRLALVAGLVSMLSFIALALPLQAHGAELQRVFWADVIASLLLAGAAFDYRRWR